MESACECMYRFSLVSTVSLVNRSLQMRQLKLITLLVTVFPADREKYNYVNIIVRKSSTEFAEVHDEFTVCNVFTKSMHVFV